MTTGIIIARFQTHYLHNGHLALIQYVKEKNDRTIVFIGTTQSRLTKGNPLNFQVRKMMVLDAFTSVEVYELPDHKYNDNWSDVLDNKINELCGVGRVTLYGSRDSFIKSYAGKYSTEIFPEIPNISSTNIRASVFDSVRNTSDFRAGIIYASGQKYPTSYQAVDVAIINFDKDEILLGKKSGESGYRFIGGFVDVEDVKLEHSAKREVIEECGDIETDCYKYICSMRINDWRYKNSEDKIMTAFFCCNYIYGRIEARDDISELKWFAISDLNENVLEPEHHELLYSLNKYLNK